MSHRRSKNRPPEIRFPGEPEYRNGKRGQVNDPFGEFGAWGPCRKCRGKGEIGEWDGYSGPSECGRCHGTGKERAR